MGKKKRGITRKQAIRRRRITKTIFFILVVVLLYFIVSRVNTFRIKKIDVVGNKKVTRDEVIKNSTYKEGYKIYLFKKSKGVEKIEKIPYVKSANINIKLPNTVNIEVVERQPIGMVSYMKKIMVFDSTGRVLETRNENEELDFTEVFGLEINNIKEGDNIFQGRDGDEKLEFIKITNNKKSLNKMKYINFSNINNIIVEMKSGEKVYFGNINDLEYKLNFLDKILKDTKKKKVNVKRIEFNKGDNPVVVTDETVTMEEGTEEKE